MVRRHLSALLALTLLAAVTSNDDLVPQLHAAAKAYAADVHAVSLVTSRNTTMDYLERLDDDADIVQEPAPDRYPTQQWQDAVRTMATLDLSLAAQLMADKPIPMASIRGFGETLVRSSSDGTLQPVAVYVPHSYAPGRLAPLIVFLHGNPQPETELLGQPFFADLAEKSGTIVVAPYGRGYMNYRGSESDIYDALDAAQAAFSIDPRKRYLAGYSMGGFSVWAVAAKRPEAWTSILCISGSLLGSEAHLVTAFLRDKQFYVLTGSDDESIPTSFPTSTAVYLRNAGFDVSFYSEPRGTHRLITLLPILTQAWHDMEEGILRAPPVALSAQPLPMQAPNTSMKP